MINRIPRKLESRGGATEIHCVLCKEEDNKPNERAYRLVTVRPSGGGSSRRMALCLAHSDRIGKPGSSYQLAAEQIRGISPGKSVRSSKYIQGKRGKGEINRDLRRLGRYSKTQRGRLGE